MKHHSILKCTLLALSLLVSVVSINCIKCIVTIEAEKTQYTGTIMTRSRASNGETVLLTYAERIDQPFTVFSNHLMEVSAVFYTNDGESDNMTVSIDGITLGIVETVEKYGEGTLWNVVRNSGPLENEVLLKPGEHEFQFFITSEDLNGVEIDKVHLVMNCSERSCESINENAYKCPDSMIQMSQYVHNEEEQFKVLLSSSKNTLGLAGVIIGGCFGLINILITLIVALIGCRNNRRRNSPNGRHERENSINEPDGEDNLMYDPDGPIAYHAFEDTM